MPIYEYRCSECEKVFEVIQKFSDDPISECKYCSGKVEKLISQSAFVLKGEGWHDSGYAGKDNRPDKSEKSEPAPAKPECAGCPSAGNKSD
ncbi:MAG: zinc ribbon domain-containing protein [Thermodesulfobacteriota bacterium]